MKSNLLDQLYAKFNIANLTHGAVHDKLGDAYEEFCVIILQNTKYLDDFLKSVKDGDWEYKLFCEILLDNGLTKNRAISYIKADDPIPPRMSHGLSKTDVIAHIFFADGTKIDLPISVKQSTVKKVAFAEFDCETIFREVGITDPELKRLIKKHQDDCSAKNFTQQEKENLRYLLEPIARDFVRWVVTGSPRISADLRIPTSIVKFDVSKDEFKLKGYTVYSIEEYIDTIMFDKNKNRRRGGFGTGLSWTYATGSRNTKIQFKG